MQFGNIENIYELSPVQEGILFHYLSEPDLGVYFQQLSFIIDGTFDLRAFEQAWRHTVEQHSILRSAFYWKQADKPLQVVYRSIQLPIELLDWRELSANQQQYQLNNFLKSDQKRGFDLAQAPLMRLTVIQLAENIHRCIWSHHHLLLDGWSVSIVLKQTLDCYHLLVKDKSLNFNHSSPYSDYIAWLGQQNLTQAETFWRQFLKGFSAPTPLGIEQSSNLSTELQNSYDEEKIFLSKHTTTALQNLAKNNQLTINTILQGVWALLLSRYSGHDDIVFGVTVSGRSATISGIETMVGLFINTLPMRVKVSLDDKLLSWLQELQAQQIELQQYEYTPLTKIQKWSEIPGNQPLFESIFVFENYPIDASLLDEDKSFVIRDIESKETTGYPLCVAGIPGSQLQLWLGYDCRRFDRETIKRVLSHLQIILESFVTKPEQRLVDIPVLSRKESHQLLVELNDTTIDYPQHQCFHELFENQVKQKPNAVAVVFEEKRLTYQALNFQANQLAHYLQSLGVGSEVRVGICLERSLEIIVCILGILKAGGVYVPIDPTYPQQRVEYMLEHSQLRLLLTQTKLLANLLIVKTEILCLDSIGDDIAKQPETNTISATNPSHLAYIIYTSGTTGLPKGVMVQHNSLVNIAYGWQKEYQLNQFEVRLLQIASFSFDVFIGDLARTIISGGTMVICSKTTKTDLLALHELIKNEQISILESTPGLLCPLLDYAFQCGSSLHHLKLLILGSDSLSAAEYNLLLNRFGSHMRIINSYGVTEATIDSSYYEAPNINLGSNLAGNIPIGKPLPNIKFYILDSQARIQPIGVAGELYIGGKGIARGYFNAPELTAAKFLDNPFSAGEKFYKTGDLARYLPDNNVELLGRIDQQVKIRGFRIELGEIETALKQHPAVQQAVAIDYENRSGNKRIAAYIVPPLSFQSEQPAYQDQDIKQISQWKTVFEDLYYELEPQQKMGFYISGWDSSYSGLPIPENEVREWMEQTVERILRLNPTRVLELGCGTGLMLFNIAPYCQHYCATDQSENALRILKHQLTALDRNTSKVSILQRSADNFEGVVANSFDSVLIVSVIQYFSSADYLFQVLKKAVNAVAPGGFIFLGDIRNLKLLEAFHTSVQLARSPVATEKKELQRQIHNQLTGETQLAIDPEFFQNLKQHLPKISHVEILLERGLNHNELSKFRYDVILHIDSEIIPVSDFPWLDWQQQGLTVAKVHQSLTEYKSEFLGITHIPNARVWKDIQAAELLKKPECPPTVQDLQKFIDRDSNAVDPEEFWALGKDLQCTVHISWSASDWEGYFDAVIQRRQKTTNSKTQRTIPAFLPSEENYKPWHLYVNTIPKKNSNAELITELRDFLKAKLPEYMIPTIFTFLDKVPLTPNGKIDRRSLPQPIQNFSEAEQKYVSPRTSKEKLLAKIWAEVLGIEQVGIHDNFFALGGDSILGIQVVAKAHKAGIQINTRHIFQYPTIIELAVAINSSQKINAEQGLVTGSIPLTPTQRWFFKQKLSNPHHWNQAIFLDVHQTINPNLLAQAITNLVVHHDALRSRFDKTASNWQQFGVNVEENTIFHEVDLSILSSPEQELKLVEIANSFQTKLNLFQGPLIQAVLFDLGSQKPSRLLFIIHHLVMDGVSLRILLEDLETLYQQLNQSKPISLPSKTTSFQYWSKRLSKYAQSSEVERELSYWLAIASKQNFSLPVDCPNGINTAAYMEILSVSLSQEVTQELLQTVPKVYETQINDVLLTALVEVMTHWTNNSSVLIDLEGHGREDIFEDVDLTRTIGWFTTFFPVFLKLNQCSQIGEKLKSIQEQLHCIPSRGLGYGLLRYLSQDIDVVDKLATLPQAQICFNYMGQLDQVLSQSSLFTLTLNSTGQVCSSDAPRHYLVEINALVIQGQLQFNWSYSSNIHSKNTIENLAQNLIDFLERIVKSGVASHVQHFYRNVE